MSIKVVADPPFLGCMLIKSRGPFDVLIDSKDEQLAGKISLDREVSMLIEIVLRHFLIFFLIITWIFCRQIC